MSDNKIEVKAYSDIFVTYLFASPGNEDILLKFVNSVLEDSGFKRITSVTVNNPFDYRKNPDGKQSVLDVLATDEEGRKFNIEIQAEGNQVHRQRILYYWSSVYASQLQKGEDHKILRPVVSINLLNFNLIKDEENLHCWFWLTKNDDPESIFSDHLILHFIELPKLTDEIDHLSALEKWAYFFRYEGDMEKDIEFIYKDDKELERAHKKFEEFMANEELREYYRTRMMAEASKKLDLDYAKEEGEVIGKIKGEIQAFEKLYNEGIITEEKYKNEVEPLREKLDELSKSNN